MTEIKDLSKDKLVTLLELIEKIVLSRKEFPTAKIQKIRYWLTRKGDL